MFSTVDRVVRDIASSIGDPEARQYVRLLRQLVRSMADLNFNLIPDIRSKPMDVGADFTINCPDDCVGVIKVGKVLTDNTIRLLGKEQMVVLPEDSCTCDACTGTVENSTTEQVTANVCDYWKFYNYNYGSVYGEMYACKTDRFENGTWFWDKKTNKLVFNSGYDVYEGSKMLVMYESSFNKDAMKLIPDEHYEMARSHVLWNFYQSDKPRESDTHLKNLRIHVGNYKDRKTRASIDEWVAAFLGNTNTP